MFENIVDIKKWGGGGGILLYIGVKEIVIFVLDLVCYCFDVNLVSFVFCFWFLGIGCGIVLGL